MRLELALGHLPSRAAASERPLALAVNEARKLRQH